MTASEGLPAEDAARSGSGSASLPERPRSRTMPAYYQSQVSSAVKKQRRQQESAVTGQLFLLREEKKQHTMELQSEARKVMRKVPMDLLASDWFNLNVDTIEMRAYLVDKVMPQIVMGLEKLLMEADARGLPYVAEEQRNRKSDDPEKELELAKVAEIIGDVEKRPEDDPSFDPNFNPVNFLARFLMRNNPRFNNQSETSPYARGLRVVSQALKEQVYSSEENKLANIKMEAKKKREEREQRERERQAELARKQAENEKLFKAWLEDPEEPGALVQVAFIQNALRSFHELVQKLPEDLKENARFDCDLEQTDATGSTLNEWQFVKYMMKHVHLFSPDMFDMFIGHMTECARAYHAANRLSRRQKIYTDLFHYLDTNIGYINRQTIVTLLRKYWFKCGKEKRALLRDPRKWPIVEIDEADEDAPEPLDDEDELGDGDEGEKVPSEEVEDGEEGEGEGEGNQDEAVEGEAQGEAAESEPQPAPDAQTAEAPGEAKAESVGDGETAPPADEANPELSVPVDPEAAVGAGGASTMKEPEDPSEDAGEAGEGEGEVDPEGGEPEAEETASIKEERDIIKEIKEAELERQKTDLMEAQLPKPIVTKFDSDMLTRDQFELLVENFLGETCPDKTLYSFISYIRDYYIERESDKLERLTKLNTDSKEKFNTHIVETLFDQWDTDGKGYIELQQFIVAAEKYKDGAEQEALETGLDEVGDVPDNQLTKPAFVNLVTTICGHMTDGLDQLQPFVQFLADSQDKTYEDRMRGLARKKWLDEITSAAQRTGEMEKVYHAVFQALYRDAETHGRNKRISANICLLEKIPAIEIGEQPGKVLRCVAATTDDAAVMLDGTITPDMPNVSFPAIATREPIHVPKVLSHGFVHFWNPSSRQKDGSLIVCPVLDGSKCAFATLSVDSCRTQNKETGIFLAHEIAFIQGVAQRFSQAFTLIDIKRRSLKIVESCIKWIKLNCPSVQDCTHYLVEYAENEPGTDFTLRMMVGSDYRGEVTYFTKPPALALADNMFKEYLYKAVSNSETVVAEGHGQYHMACPIRDEENYARSVMDINIGANIEINRIEKLDLLRMLRIQQIAFIFMEAEAKGKVSETLTVEKDMGGSASSILFERIMLMEMRKALSEIDSEIFAEIKSYTEPPKVVLQIVDILIELFLAKKKDQFNNWTAKKLVLSSEMLKRVASFDPTAVTDVDHRELRKMLDGIDKQSFSDKGPFPAEVLYNWLTVSISLMEHADNFRSATASQAPAAAASDEVTAAAQEQQE